MDKKIKFINIATIKLLPVILLLLCNCIVYAQKATEIISRPIDTALISLPQQQPTPNSQAIKSTSSKKTQKPQIQKTDTIRRT